MAITSFEELDCWKSARELVKLSYQYTVAEPFDKDWDMRSQFRRAALSSMNNIAEGFARYGTKEFIPIPEYFTKFGGRSAEHALRV